MLAGSVVQWWGAHDDPQHPNNTEVKNVCVDDSEMHMKERSLGGEKRCCASSQSRNVNTESCPFSPDGPAIITEFPPQPSKAFYIQRQTCSTVICKENVPERLTSFKKEKKHKSHCTAH